MSEMSRKSEKMKFKKSKKGWMARSNKLELNRNVYLFWGLWIIKTAFWIKKYNFHFSHATKKGIWETQLNNQLIKAVSHSILTYYYCGWT